MNCAEWEERIALYAEGDAPQEAVLVEQHLAACGECREFAAGLRESLALLREAHTEPLPAAHFTAVRARVLEQLAVRRTSVWRRVWSYGLAAVALTVLVGAGLWRRPSVPPPPSMVVLTPPPAPAVARVNRPRRHAKRAVQQIVKTEPLMIRIVTDDPDVVLYWIADKKGDD